MKFKATVRQQKSKLGTFGKVVSRELESYIGKEVEIEIKEAK